jgi:hypothetical protein
VGILAAIPAEAGIQGFLYLLDPGFYLKVSPRDLPGIGESREPQFIRHSGGSRNPEKSLDPGFRRGDGYWNLVPGFSCSVVTDRVMAVRRGDDLD